MESEWKFRFVKIYDESEGSRTNRLGKQKKDYLGQVCRQVGIFPPYTMQFTDGAMWALDTGQIKPIGKAVLNHQKYNVPVVCVETGQEFNNKKEAADLVSVTKGAIYTAICSGCKAGGYHWKNKGEEYET